MARLQRAPDPRDFPDVEGLPAGFAALALDFNDALPNTEENRSRALDIAEALRNERPLVVLDRTSWLVDRLRAEPRPSGLLRRRRRPEGHAVVHVDELLPSHTALARRTSVVARSTTLVGTYCGLATLAPLLGIPALCVYSEAHELDPRVVTFQTKAVGGEHLLAARHISEVDHPSVNGGAPAPREPARSA
jgi:hypothetical protein